MILERLQDWLINYQMRYDSFNRADKIIVNCTWDYWKQINSELRSTVNYYAETKPVLEWPKLPLDRIASIHFMIAGVTFIVIRSDYNLISPLQDGMWENSEQVFNPTYIKPKG